MIMVLLILEVDFLADTLHSICYITAEGKCLINSAWAVNPCMFYCEVAIIDLGYMHKIYTV